MNISGQQHAAFQRLNREDGAPKAVPARAAAEQGMAISAS
jgi:hypothetical protein